jgi:short-subunit dehydrogenase
MKPLKDKIILITGGSSGIGAILAELVVKNGGTPILIARSEINLIQVTNTIEAKYQQHVPYYVTDVSNTEQVKLTFQSLLSTYPTIDILVNNAGYGIFQAFKEAPEEDFEAIMKVNYLGTVFCTKQVLPSMLQNKKGHIINVASQAGKMSTPKSTAYTASKHAVLGFTNSLRLELRKESIMVTAVNPGPIRTTFFNKADSSGEYVKNISKYMLEPSFVAEEIIKVMIKPKREVNLPKWMDFGSRLFNLFPNTMDKLVGKRLDKK